jgi:hypothetical protein
VGVKGAFRRLVVRLFLLLAVTVLWLTGWLLNLCDTFRAFIREVVRGRKSG